MSLHPIYHPANAFSTADKQGLAERITALYKAAGLPTFYVNIIFVSIEKDSLFVGDQQNEATKKKFMEKYENAVSPYIEEKGYDWQIHAEEVSNETWRLNGLILPAPNSKLEKHWIRYDRID